MNENEKEYIKKIFDEYFWLLNNKNLTLLENKLSKIDEIKYDKELDMKNQIEEIHKLKENINDNEQFYYEKENYFYPSDNESTQFETNYNIFMSGNHSDEFFQTDFEKNYDIQEEKIEELANEIIDEIINKEYDVQIFVSLFIDEFYHRLNNYYEKIIFE